MIFPWLGRSEGQKCLSDFKLTQTPKFAMFATHNYETDLEITPNINLVVGHYCDWNKRVEKFWYFCTRDAAVRFFDLDTDKAFKTTEAAKKYAIAKIIKFLKKNIELLSKQPLTPEKA